MVDDITKYTVRECDTTRHENVICRSTLVRITHLLVYGRSLTAQIRFGRAQLQECAQY